MNGTDKKILLVEDEPIAQTLYQNRLQREGFKISFAEDGELALSALAKDKPDLVVLDLMLPKLNGPEVLKHIRSEERLKSTPVLIISNAYMSELSQKAMESGATRGMLKTECTPGRLVETVRDMLGFRSAFDVSDKPVSDDKQAEEFAAAAESAMQDELKLKETREEFIQKAPGEIAKIRELCLAYVKSASTPAGEQPLGNLYKLVRFFATRAGLSGCVRTALLASAFEALLFEAVFKPGKATPSVAQTFAQAVDCLERLSQNNPGTTEIIPKAKILVVDDDAVCNFAMVGALRRAHFEPVSTEDPQKALEMAQTGRYDVVFLDINMPVMNGFQVCERLRGIPEYRDTPVIFITSNGDFQNRARSILSGGNDLIPKPVSPVELVLKTTIRLLQPQSSLNEKSTSAAAQREAQATPPAGNAAPVTLPPPALIETGAATPPPILKLAASESRIDFAKLDAAKETAKAKDEAPIPSLKMKEEPAKVEKPKEESPKVEPAKTEAPKVELPKVELPKLELPKVESPKVELPKEEPPKVELPKMEPVAKETPAPIVPPPIPTIAIEKPAPPKAEPIEKPVHVNGDHKPVEIKLEVKEPPKEALAAHAEKPASQTISSQDRSTTKPPVTPISPKLNNTNNKKTAIMETKKTTIDEAARGVAQIIFGDENITDMNVRLTRIALERYAGGTKTLAEIARGVTQIIFGDENISDMNVRLTRIALERYNVAELLGSSATDAAPKVVAMS
jgi:CheY-like chemotaxis protein